MSDIIKEQKFSIKKGYLLHHLKLIKLLLSLSNNLIREGLYYENKNSNGRQQNAQMGANRF